MNFPWKKRKSTDRLAISWDGETFSYVQISGSSNSGIKIINSGVLRFRYQSMQSFAAKIKSLRLDGDEVILQLTANQYSLLQIDAPPVPDIDLKMACRYEIKDMIEGHIDEYSIDVIRLGNETQQWQGHVFVAAAKISLIKELTEFCKKVGISVGVIDIQETAQRNLQTRYSISNELNERAVAFVNVINENQALITISANNELYYFRRLDIPKGFIGEEWGSGYELFNDVNNIKAQQDYSEYSTVSDEVIDEIPLVGLSYENYDGISGIPLENDKTSKIIVEIQRSIDLWERTWRNLPLAARVCFCGSRSIDFAGWLSQEMNQLVSSITFGNEFDPLLALDTKDQIFCLPLVGSLLRYVNESAKV